MMKVVLVTGAARRVGAEIARVMHSEGFRIAVHYNQSQAEALQLVDHFNQVRADSAIAVHADLSVVAACKGLISHVLEHFGQLDVLVNNASRFYRTPLCDADEKAWDDLMNSNLKAPFFLSKEAASALAQQKGCIVNIADIHGERPMRDYSIYCLSKAGLLMLTKSLAHELGPDVRVNSISPGIVALPEGENELDPEIEKRILQKIALRRHGTPGDIAGAVLFLVKGSEFMTGQVITLDGGRTLSL